MNVLDLIIVLSGLSELGFDILITAGISDNTGGSGAGDVFKVLRMLRITRPLMSVKKHPRFYIIFKAVIDSIPNLGYVMIFLLFTMLIFSVFGLHIF